MPHVCALVIAAIVLLPAIPASSQTFYGGVRGAVRDDTGVIVGAAMTLTDERTSVARSTDTNAAGEYTFANALPGLYTLTATLPGFKSFERRGLLVGTQQVVVVDIVLEVGAVAEQITVTGETPALDRASASVASMIDRSALENIPSTGRNPFLFSTTLPTALERAGDFSRSVDAAGRPLIIYDPLTTRPNPDVPGEYIRDPFPGNIIPAGRIDPVTRQLMTMYPLPDEGRTRTRAAPVSDVANQVTAKVDHHFTRHVRLSATGAWYGSAEPSPLFYDGLPSDPLLGDISRNVRMLALNGLWAPVGSTVYEVRYGYLSYDDDFTLPTFDVGSLGFAPAFVAAIPVAEFPGIEPSDYSPLGSTGSRLNGFPSHTINGTVTRLVGRHTLKAGADYRHLGMDLQELGTSGTFSFSQAYTQGPDPNVPSATAGDAVASLLLGLPVSGGVRIGTPLGFNASYYAAFVQDDLRAGPHVTLNGGLRYEYETGLAEGQNQFTVGFDRERPFPVQLAGLNLRGGLMFADEDGYPTRQSDPNRSKFGPRVGISWALNDRTVLRGGYGLFWGPHQFQNASEDTFGTRGYSATSSYVSTTDGGLTPCDGCQLQDPFTNRLEQPQGSALGLLTGAGSDIHFNDQFRRSPYLHKYSVDTERELPGAFTIRAGYVGSRGGNLSTMPWPPRRRRPQCLGA